MKKIHGGFTPMRSSPLDNSRAMFRHQSLMQDFEELHEETQAKRRRLKNLKERKAMVVAEVRFLRRRYKHLTRDQRGRKLRFQAESMQEASPDPPHVMKNRVSIPDLNQSERVHEENETNPKGRVPVFDLNQISGEEEKEPEAENEQWTKVMDPKAGPDERTSNSRRRMGLKETSVLLCRKGGNRLNKRKISWQDPVAVRM
ncbi:PREDICTED: uncharacterized protein LOC104813538 [Tarenaya hassleriana]|uniref:uncharacterized protein LOC104813538 n=1 Tax=Tarenaya hassleriana TaxID=28532 RepID=UPI00053C115C|nr:PREDICTED: uncharacterized protein LOC104813538 [Tarenaya hassleriana]